MKQILKQILDNVKHKEISNGSYAINNEDDIREALSFIKNVNVADNSHFGSLSYWVADKNPYIYKNAGFCVEEHKVYVETPDGRIYTGLRLDDKNFDGMRINDYGDYFGLLFDFRINGAFSSKCYRFDVYITGVKNNEVSLDIQKYRELLHTDPEAAESHLDKAHILMFETQGVRDDFCLVNDEHIIFEGAEIYYCDKSAFNKKAVVVDGVIDVGGKNKYYPRSIICSLSPHPFPFKVLQQIQGFIKNLPIPKPLIKGFYYYEQQEGEKKGVFVIVHSSAFQPESLNSVVVKSFESAIPDITLNASLLFAVSDKGCSWLPDDVVDLYEILNGWWLSDHLYVPPIKEGEDDIGEADVVGDKEGDDSGQLCCVGDCTAPHCATEPAPTATTTKQGVLF